MMERVQHATSGVDIQQDRNISGGLGGGFARGTANATITRMKFGSLKAPPFGSLETSVQLVLV
jgi:hypothetical protein